MATLEMQRPPLVGSGACTEECTCVRVRDHDRERVREWEGAIGAHRRVGGELKDGTLLPSTRSTLTASPPIPIYPHPPLTCHRHSSTPWPLGWAGTELVSRSGQAVRDAVLGPSEAVAAAGTTDQTCKWDYEVGEGLGGVGIVMGWSGTTDHHQSTQRSHSCRN